MLGTFCAITLKGRDVNSASEERSPILEATGLSKVFVDQLGFLGRGGERAVRAVQDFNLALERGSTVGLVGESGCGKSTVARMLMLLEAPTEGGIRLNGELLDHFDRNAVRKFRRSVQMVFQDPYASINPAMSVGEAVAEPLLLQRRDLSAKERRKIVIDRLEDVGLGESDLGRRSTDFSGGQLQRIGIARALTLEPSVLICDEPVSALDVSIQAHVLNLLKDIQKRLELSVLFISHDLSVVRYLCDNIAVMYLGRIVEEGPTNLILSSPAHPYTQALVSSEPSIDPEPEAGSTRIILQGELPDPANPPSGCPFRTRCWKAEEKCAEQRPERHLIDVGHHVACHLANAS